MLYTKLEVLDTPTPEAYGCAHMDCRNRATVVWIVQTSAMPAPGFYGHCDEHPRGPSTVDGVTYIAKDCAEEVIEVSPGRFLHESVLGGDAPECGHDMRRTFAVDEVMPEESEKPQAQDDLAHPSTVSLLRDEDCPDCGWPETYAEVNPSAELPGAEAVGCRMCGWRVEVG